jgi:hypothetical protein
MLLQHHPTSDFAVLQECEIISFRNEAFCVPKGFLFNGANIPSICWTILRLHPWHPRLLRAALLHDYLYSKGRKVKADKAFKSMLKADGCNKFQYMACYWAVRLFGGRFVNKGAYYE